MWEANPELETGSVCVCVLGGSAAGPPLPHQEPIASSAFRPAPP